MLKYHIQTIEVGSGGANAMSFYSIPQDFDDLYITLSLRFNPSSVIDNTIMRFNQTTSNYSYRVLRGTGSSRESYTGSTNFFFLGETNGANSTSNTFANQSVYISNYKSTTSKSVSIDSVMENNATEAYQNIIAGLWANTAPVTSIDVKSVSDFGIIAGSTISLYGIKRGSDGKTEAASGGAISFSGGYTIHTFQSSGTFVANRNMNVEYLVVGGGAGGGTRGGGGAGGFINSTPETNVYLASGTSWAVSVGAGGSGGFNNSGGATRPTAGATSAFAGIFSEGGGKGATSSNYDDNAGSGGSGGGASAIGAPVGLGNTPATSPSQGNNGGTGAGTGGGGGGGAGGIGGNAASNIGGNGGAGLSSSISGGSVAYAGGGGGGGNSTAGTSSAGGGTGSTGFPGGNGTANTGGGGGGGVGAFPEALRIGGNGGSGVVIIRYLTP